MKQTVVINVVGLTAKILEDKTLFISQWSSKDKQLAIIKPVLPAVTCSMQTTYLTGKLPAEHGIIGNGWYNKELSEVQFWKQSNKLVKSPNIWDEARGINPNFTCANMFWWYNMYSSVDYSVTPRPQYWANGLKKPDCYSSPSTLRDELQKELGIFPLFDFWGPRTTIKSSQWIADASKYVHDKYNPTLQLIYLPHLDYCFQKYDYNSKEVQKDIKDLDSLLKDLIAFYETKNITPIILSEYGISSVSKPIHLNRIFRKQELLNIRVENGKELLDAAASKAFAVADHQVAHIYCLPHLEDKVMALLKSITDIDEVLDKQEQQKRGLWHERSGNFMVVAKEEAWFTYYYWLDDKKAPDFARTVDIHKKPGYDPVEMFLNTKIRGLKLKLITKLLLKKIGFRVLFDVIPLTAELIKGSHGRTNVSDSEKPIIVAAGNDKKHIEAVEVKDVILSNIFGSIPNDKKNNNNEKNNENMEGVNTNYQGMVVKVSVSDMRKSIDFYCNVLGGKIDERYTITKKEQPKAVPYVQLLFNNMGVTTAIGLYNDIKEPFKENTNGVGTIPTLVVENIEEMITFLKDHDVECSEIISNTSDQGYTDKFAFFNDIDNNAFALRENVAR